MSSPGPHAADRRLASELGALSERRLYRRRRVVEERPGPMEVVVDGRTCVNFCSNDYLGLSADPRLADDARRAAERWGTGSGAAHLVTGHTALHHALEEELAEFTGRPRALLFSTGYMANLGVAAALVGRSDTVLEDRLNHASLLDAARLTGARIRRYAHADASAFGRRLASAAGDVTVFTDGVFSMDGDLAPLDRMAPAARERGARLVVDDAHGLGVLGTRGGGCLEVFGLGLDDVPVLVGTLGKAFGTFGAFVAGSEALVETLIQRARTYIYTTAPPPGVAAATRRALAIAREETWRRERLDALVRRFRDGAAQLGLALPRSPTPIQPVVVGEAAAALAASESLLAEGFMVTAIRPPTVPAGSARLRVTLSATHTDDQVDGLLDALGRAVVPGAGAGTEAGARC